MAERRAANGRRRQPYQTRNPGGNLARRHEELQSRVEQLEDRIVEVQALWLSLLATTVNGENHYGDDSKISIKLFHKY